MSHTLQRIAQGYISEVIPYLGIVSSVASPPVWPTELRLTSRSVHYGVLVARGSSRPTLVEAPVEASSSASASPVVWSTGRGSLSLISILFLIYFFSL